MHRDAITATTLPAYDQTFGYDELGRLTGITTSSATWSLGYDANGHRTAVTTGGTTRAYTTAATSNRLDALTNPARSFTCDSAGNTTDSGRAARSTRPLTSATPSWFSACLVVTYVIPIAMLDVREYLDEDGTSPFAEWFAVLDATAAARITVALARIEQGNLSNVKGVGEGVLEYRLDFGPGYRVYFGRDGDVLVILLAGGTKKRQQRDIEAAQARWAAYKRRKRSAR
ncbi:type II toxin-antitoxin system RelE/ParE family toxin [Piscinibacter sakaiensis]|nr:type II toxin-antitoxin system RelE/ParE family toxin [Piscinibacter sakaiensis]